MVQNIQDNPKEFNFFGLSFFMSFFDYYFDYSKHIYIFAVSSQILNK